MSFSAPLGHCHEEGEQRGGGGKGGGREGPDRGRGEKAQGLIKVNAQGSVPRDTGQEVTQSHRNFLSSAPWRAPRPRESLGPGLWAVGSALSRQWCGRWQQAALPTAR